MQSRSCSVGSGLLRRSGDAPALIILVLGALSLAACASETVQRPSGAPRIAAPGSVPARIPAAPPDAPWDLAAELKRVHPAGERAPSQHFSGDLEGEVLGNDAASAYAALGPARGMPEGAEIVLVLRAPGDLSARHYLAMRKRAPGFDPEGADWEYAVAKPSGEIEERGRIPGCRRCHAEAPHDFMFGRARVSPMPELP